MTTATATPAPKSTPARRPRTVQVFLTIADTAGKVAAYTAVPLPTAADGTRRVRLLKHAGRGEPPAVAYTCELTPTGQTACECQGFKYSRHCKHLDALNAAGLLSAAQALEGRRLELTARQAVDQLDAARAELGGLRAELRAALDKLDAASRRRGRFYVRDKKADSAAAES